MISCHKVHRIQRAKPSQNLRHQALCYPPWLKMIDKPEAEAIMEAIVSRHLNKLDDDAADLAVLKLTKDKLKATLVSNVNQDYLTKTMAKKLFKVTHYGLVFGGTSDVTLMSYTVLLPYRSPIESSKGSRRTRFDANTGRLP